MHISTLLALASLAAVATARKCKDITVPVSLSARNAVFDLELPLTEIEVTDFYLNFGRQGHNYSAEIVNGYATVSGDYKLAATYCEPDHGPGPLVQILTHGIGFDRSYWDLAYNNYNYSYVASAVDERGHSTLAWDRLGIAHSSKGDPLSEIQIFLEIAALKALTQRARDGSLPGLSGLAFDTVVHVGHSFGSSMTYSLASSDPHLSDGIILTGFSQVPAFIGLFALGGGFAPLARQKMVAGGYPKGYIAGSSSMGSHNNFFGPGDFDPGLLEYYTRRAQPNTPGEVLTVGAGGGDASCFPGPVLVITGERDVPFCGGDCFGTSAIQDSAPNLIAFSEQFFPKASQFNASIVPGAGHGLNMGYSHPVAYDLMLDFVDMTQ